MSSKPKIITLTGPESTGKSTLCLALATHFSEPQVIEYARDYLQKIARPYEEKDLWEIAKGQHDLIEKARLKAKEYLFVDTDAWTVFIWAKVRYGRVDARITELARKQSADHYLLCGTDVPWQYDPLREHPNDREMLYDLYLRRLEEEGLKFTELSGGYDRRIEEVLGVLSSI